MVALVVALCLSVQFHSAVAESRSDRIWPIGRSTSVDLGQSSPFGPRLQISMARRYAELLLFPPSLMKLCMSMTIFHHS